MVKDPNKKHRQPDWITEASPDPNISVAEHMANLLVVLAVIAFLTATVMLLS